MKMSKILAAVLGLGLALATPRWTLPLASAQEYGSVGGYYAVISEQDMYNSRGVRLGDLGAVLQQDRANYHRFGRGQPGDEWDPFFGDRGARSTITQLYRASGGQPELETMIRRGQPFRAYILLCGYGGRPSVLIAVPDWWDGHSGCF